MEGKVAQMEAEQEQTQATLDALTSKLKEAKGKLETAKQKLLTTHEHDVTELKGDKARDTAAIELHTKHITASRNVAMLELTLLTARGTRVQAANRLSVALNQQAARSKLKPIRKFKQV